MISFDFFHFFSRFHSTSKSFEIYTHTHTHRSERYLLFMLFCSFLFYFQMRFFHLLSLEEKKKRMKDRKKMLDNEELAKKKKKKEGGPISLNFNGILLSCGLIFFLSLSLIRPLLVPHNRHTKFFLFLKAKRKQCGRSKRRRSWETAPIDEPARR